MRIVRFIACLGFVFALHGLSPQAPPDDPDIPEKVSPSSKWQAPRVKYQPTPAKPIPDGPKGTVVVQFKIGSDGLPSRIKAIQGPPDYYEYSEAYVSKWIFYPATLDGKPVGPPPKLGPRKMLDPVNWGCPSSPSGFQGLGLMVA